MLRNKKKVRSNTAQLQMLVDYMSKHQKFAHLEFSGPAGQRIMMRHWEEVRAMLSEHGHDKTVEQWKHTWRDLKKRAREESRIRQSIIQTGKSSFVPTLSEMSTKVLNIIGKECGTGDPEETGIVISSPFSNTDTNLSSNQEELEFLVHTEVIPVSSQVSQPSQPLVTPTSATIVQGNASDITLGMSPPVQSQSPSPPAASPTPQQRRTAGISGRADELLAAKKETNEILRDILSTMQAGLVQDRMKYRQMLRNTRTRRFL